MHLKREDINRNSRHLPDDCKVSNLINEIKEVLDNTVPKNNQDFYKS